jgi:hypothetical protein
VEEPYAEIIHYFSDPTTGENVVDDFGEPKIGWYWRIRYQGRQISPEHGPYSTREEAEASCIALTEAGKHLE